MPRIGFEQQELLVRSMAYLLGQPGVPLPKAFRGPVPQTAFPSKRLRSPAPVIVRRLLHQPVQTACVRIRLNAEIDRLRPAELVKPSQQFFQLLRRKAADSRFDLLNVGHNCYTQL